MQADHASVSVAISVFKERAMLLTIVRPGIRRGHMRGQAVLQRRIVLPKEAQAGVEHAL